MTILQAVVFFVTQIDHVMEKYGDKSVSLFTFFPE